MQERHEQMVDLLIVNAKESYMLTKDLLQSYVDGDKNTNFEANLHQMRGIMSSFAIIQEEIMRYKNQQNKLQKAVR